MKTALITGCSSGYGLETARHFHARGWNVVATMRNPRQDILPRSERMRILPLDVTNDESIAAALDASGPIDVLVNNAGIVHRSAFRDTALDVFRRVMEVNFFGSLQMTKAALEALIARQGLVIVVSSVAGVAPLYGRSGYSASKHALHGLFESLRAELAGSGLEVLMVCPSFTRSAFEQRALDADGGRVTRGRSRVGTEAAPDDVARAIFDAARRRQRLLVHTPVGKLAFALSRLAPGVYEKLMVKKLASELGVTG